MPLALKIDERDNVAIVVDRRRPAGRQRVWTTAPCCARMFRRGTRWRCRHRRGRTDRPLRRSDRPRRQAIAARQLGRRVARRACPQPPALDDLPLATRPAPDRPPLEGYTFEGYRNADGTVGTKNMLGITTSVQCVAGVADYVVAAHQGGAAAALSARRRRGGAEPRLRLRRGDQRARPPSCRSAPCRTSRATPTSAAR